MKCKWYADFEGVCTNGECPYRGEVCPTSEYPEVCRHAEAAPEVLKLKAPRLSAKELAKTLRLCDSTSCSGCALFEFVNCGSAAKQQAADMLEQLAAENDAQKPEWISVKDGPPKTPDTYFCCVNSLAFPGIQYVKPVKFCGDGGWWKDADVTHWMPPPKPPKKDNNHV